MDRTRPIVVRGGRGAALPAGQTAGMRRVELLDDRDRWVGWVATDAGLAGGWHHHGDRDSYIWVLRGRVTIEYGPGGRERLAAAAGDFIYNPPRLVHREITGPDQPAEFFVVRVGDGAQTVNVDGPDQAGDPDP